MVIEAAHRPSKTAIGLEPHPSLLGLARLLGRQAAKEWLAEALTDFRDPKANFPGGALNSLLAHRNVGINGGALGRLTI